MGVSHQGRCRVSGLFRDDVICIGSIIGGDAQGTLQTYMPCMKLLMHWALCNWNYHGQGSIKLALMQPHKIADLI